MLKIDASESFFPAFQSFHTVLWRTQAKEIYIMSSKHNLHVLQKTDGK